MAHAGALSSLDSRVSQESLETFVQRYKTARPLLAIDDETLLLYAMMAGNVEYESAEDIQKQVLHGASVLIGHGKKATDNPLYLVTKSDEEIVDMLKNGRWMSITQMRQAGSEKQEIYLRNLLIAQQLAQQKQTDCSILVDCSTGEPVAYVTQKNMMTLGITHLSSIGFIVKKAPKENPPAAPSGNGSKPVVPPTPSPQLPPKPTSQRGGFYDQSTVVQMLYGYNSVFRDPKVRDRTLSAYSIGARVSETQVQTLRSEFDGMLLAYSERTQRKLAEASGVPQDKIAALISISGCVKKLQGTDLKYIRRADIEDLTTWLLEQRGVEERGPPSMSNGYIPFDIRGLRRRIPDWREFEEEVLAPFIGLGVLQRINDQSYGHSFMAVKDGMGRTVSEAAAKYLKEKKVAATSP